MWYFDEYQIDPQSFTELSIINQLAEIEVLDWRLNNNLSKVENSELIQDSTVAVDPEGNPIIQRQVSAFLEAKERIMNRKARLITMMVGDRKERYKREAALKIRDTKDPSESMATIRKKLESLQRDIAHQALEIQKKSGVVDATFTEGSEPAISPEDILGGEA